MIPATLNIAALSASFFGLVALISTNILQVSEGYDPSANDKKIVSVVNLTALGLVIVGTTLQQVEIIRKRRAIFNVTHRYASDF